MRLVIWECRFRRRMEEGMEDSLYTMRLELCGWRFRKRIERDMEDNLYNVRLELLEVGPWVESRGAYGGQSI